MRMSILVVAAVVAWVPAGAALGQAERFAEQAVLAQPAPGKHVGWAADRVPKGFSVKDRIVVTYYFYWYDDASGAHFVDADGSDALTDHPAEPKGYSYLSADWHRRELKDMTDAGIDVALPVYWGNPADSADPKGGLRWSYAGLPPLVEAWRQLEAAGAKPPRIGCFVDTSTLQHNAAGRRVDLSTADGRAWFYVTIRDFFSLVPPDLWAAIDGRPIVFLYAAAFAAGGTDDPKLVEYLNEHFAKDFGGTRPYLVAEQSWRLPADSTCAWGAAFGLRSLGVAAVGPGYDDSAVPGRTTPRQDRENGAFYRRNWDRLLAMAPARRPTIVAVETWNELHEGTDVCATREYGRQYIDLTRHYAQAWKAGKHLAPTGPYARAAQVTITFGPKGKDEGLHLRTGADGLAKVTRAGDADCVQTLANPHGPGAYLYVDVDDSFYFDTGGSVEVAVEYLDEGAQPMGLHYDSSDPSATLAGAYKAAADVPRTGTGAWKTATFILKDARLVNRQNLGSDLRLFTPGDPLKVRRIVVRRTEN